MFRWLLGRQRYKLQPEAKFVVDIIDGVISLRDDKGRRKELPLAELRGVGIETNDTGPVGTDVWWLLFGKMGRLALVVPQGATGENTLIDLVTGLPGFNFEAMTTAMSCTDNETFLVWPTLAPVG